MIPIKDANPTRRTPWVTLALIAANVLVFLLWQPTLRDPGAEQGFFFCNAQIPWEIANGENLAQGGEAARAALDTDFASSYGTGVGRDIQSYLRTTCPTKSPWLSLIVSMFMHGGWLHIIGNMLYLWIFGNNVEDRLGTIRYVLFYLLGGIAASALQFVFDPASTVPSLGASGAIGAVLGAYLVMFPRARVTTLMLWFVITVIQIPAIVVLGVWFVLQLFSGLGSVGITGGGGIAYWAHVGGFAFGALAALTVFRGRAPRSFDPYAG